jgi:hypothetical protein
MRRVFKSVVCFVGVLSVSTLGGRADVVHQDDAIVIGSLGVGFDVVNGENFGFDTIRLKENNVRIAFIDTSNSSSFPTRDWRIIVNDSTNGGENHFSIEDSDIGTMPFRIFAGAPDSALVVDANGDIGLGNLNPVVELHITDGDSPAMRLEQNGSSGFTAQTWDLAGNEANFFVRDVTNGSKLPFKIRSNAPNNSLYVDTDGDIGLGTSTPSAKLHVVGDGRFTTGGLFEGNTKVSLGTSGATASADADELVIEDDDNAGISILTPSNKTGNLFFGDTINNAAGGLTYLRGFIPGFDNLKFIVGGANSLILSDNGSISSETGASLSSGGAWIDASSRELKTDISELSAEKAMETLKSLKPVEFVYKAEKKERKVGFIAEDVPELVATNDRKGLSSIDFVGVLTRVVQKQQEELENQNALILDLKSQLTRIQDSLNKQ